MNQSDVDIENITELEFAKPCSVSSYRTRDTPASWAIWVSHGGNCKPGDFYICDRHKQMAEEAWIELLGTVCVCGFLLTGQLSDHVKAIRL